MKILRYNKVSVENSKEIIRFALRKTKMGPIHNRAGDFNPKFLTSEGNTHRRQV